MKKITIKEDKTGLSEGIFVVNPQWIHLDEKEIEDRLKKGEKLFKVSVDECDAF
jgi:hypothetical protein